MFRSLLATLMLAQGAQAATLSIVATHPSPSGLNFTDVWDVDPAQGSLAVATPPRLFIAQWLYESGPYTGLVSGYTDAVLHLEVNFEPADDTFLGRAEAWITSSLDGADPGRQTWWPEPVTVDFEWDGLHRWSWTLPLPPLIPDSYESKPNPRTLEMVLEGVLPEPSAYWLLGMAAVVFLARRWLP